MDSPTAVIWTSIHVMKRCLVKITDGATGSAGPADGEEAADSQAVIAQLRDSVDLALAAGERQVRINRNLQKAIHSHETELITV